jgi:hypothetical protein
MQWNAFYKSQNIPPTFSLLFMAVNILFINVKDAFSVDECVMNAAS